MLLKLAWRNIWRSKTRSLVVVFAIAIGLLAGVFASGFIEGLMLQKVESVINLEMSHFQVHDTLFRNEYGVKYTIKNSDQIINRLEKDPNVKHFTTRTITTSMIATANNTGGIKVIGIDENVEPKLTPLKKNLVEGAFFEGIKRNPILVSKKTAEKYKLKLKSGVILSFQDIDNNFVNTKFKVAGIFDSKNGMYDQANVFVRQNDLKKLLNISEPHEIAVLLNDYKIAESSAQSYKQEFEDLEILPWMDLATGMRYMIDMMGMYTYILVGIIMIALIFSIINTMLMAVLDRTREIGMLMAVGMGRFKIFFMIILETIFLSFLGGPLGLLLSWLFITYFGYTGIDMGSGGEMYEDMGYASIVYPYLKPVTYFGITFMVFCMSIISAIFPSLKALSLNPVEALRKI